MGVQVAPSEGRDWSKVDEHGYVIAWL